ncbi:hypothetical protein ABEB22_21055 (plasmid) [Thioclava sp. 'Guangxiensis']|uniref:spike base protein, RCAP_Rcc01079 family n=1 Tax=Thioclava sp. 'Guangxiensis' TaxID=3149044 RepID=UPI0032C49AC5
MADDYHGITSLTGPGFDGFAITPDDGADLSQVTRGIYLGQAGDLRVTLAGGQTVTFTNMAAGGIHGLRIRRVWASGTTAADMVGLC